MLEQVISNAIAFEFAGMPAESRYYATRRSGRGDLRC
jgi:hypothetical protein